MGIVKKTITIVLLVILLLFGWFVYQNWNTIDAFIYSLTTTTEDTERDLAENKRKLQEFIDKDENIEVRDLTDEEAKALTSGELTEQEVIEIITGKAPQKEPEAKPQDPQKPQKPSETSKPKPENNSTSGDNVSQLIAKLYVEKAIYLNKLDDIEAQARYDFTHWEGKWPGTQNVKQALLNKYLPTVAGWEKECDDVVYGILDDIRLELQKEGKDDSIVDTIKKSYIQEKKLKKSYFINRYMD